MSKSIIKEIIIILLLCLAIIVVLGLLLYEYVPMSKIVPEPVSYSTPEDVKQELLEVGEIDESQVIMTYEVDSSDLNNYEMIKNYNPGKVNPFSSYQAETNTTSSNGETTSTTGNTTNNANGNTGTNTETNSSNIENGSNTSEGHYFQDKGTK